MKRNLLSVSLLLLAIFILVACGKNSEVSYNYDSFENESEVEEFQPETNGLKILESGYGIDEDNEVSVGVIYENTSEKTAYEMAELTITAYDKNGDVLATDSSFLGTILPGDTHAATDRYIDCKGQKPDKVEFSIDSGEGEQASSVRDCVLSSNIEVLQAKERENNFLGRKEISITGKIKNNSELNLSGVYINVLFKKDSKIVFGCSDFVEYLDAGAEKAFDIDAGYVPAYDSFIVMVN